MEIMHKAKIKDTGEWVEGYYVICRRHHYILPLFNITVENYEVVSGTFGFYDMGNKKQ